MNGSRPNPPRSSPAASAERAFTQLVLDHFFAILEQALRDTFQEVLGRPLPPRFLIRLDGAPRNTPSRARRPSPRDAQRGPTCPEGAGQGGGGAKRLPRKGRILNGPSAAKTKAQGE